MPDASDLADDIAESAEAPRSMSIDGNSVVQQSIDDKLKAQAHASQRNIDVTQLFGNRTRLVNGPRQ